MEVLWKSFDLMTAGTLVLGKREVEAEVEIEVGVGVEEVQEESS